MSAEFKEEKVLVAEEIVKNPGIVDGIRGRYQIVMAHSKDGFESMNRALKIMGEKGWRLVSTEGFVIPADLAVWGEMYAILEKVS